MGVIPEGRNVIHPAFLKPCENPKCGSFPPKMFQSASTDPIFEVSMSMFVDEPVLLTILRGKVAVLYFVRD